MKTGKLKINFSIFNFNDNHLDGRPTDRDEIKFCTQYDVHIALTVCQLVTYTLFYKNIVFPAQAEYSYFSANVRLKIFLLIFGLVGRDVISGKKNFYNSLNKRRFLFRKDIEVDFSLGKHDNTQ